jgi:acyl-coenzyme A thioesterase 13
MAPQFNREGGSQMGSYEFVDDVMEKNRSGELRSPVSQHLDMQLVEFGRGEAVYKMPVREELSNPLGVIQGGVATALADAAMAAATTTILDDEEIQKSAITTVDIFARFIRPVNLKSATTLRAEAKVVRVGGRLVWAEADVLADGEIVGKFDSTGIRVSFDPQAYAGTGESSHG